MTNQSPVDKVSETLGEKNDRDSKSERQTERRTDRTSEREGREQRTQRVRQVRRAYTRNKMAFCRENCLLDNNCFGLSCIVCFVSLFRCFILSALHFLGVRKDKQYQVAHIDNRRFVESVANSSDSSALPSHQGTYGETNKSEDPNRRFHICRGEEKRQENIIAGKVTSEKERNVGEEYSMPVFVLEAREYETIIFKVPYARPTVRYLVEAEHPVSAYVLDEQGLLDLEESGDFEYYEGRRNRLKQEYEVTLPFGGKWYLVIINEQKTRVGVRYEIYVPRI